MIMLLECPKCKIGIWGCEDTIFNMKTACKCSSWGADVANSCYYIVNGNPIKKHLCPECFNKENRYGKLRLK